MIDDIDCSARRRFDGVSIRPPNVCVSWFSKRLPTKRLSPWALRCRGYLQGAREVGGGCDLPAAPVVHHHVLHHVREPDGRRVQVCCQPAQWGMVADEDVAANVRLRHLLHGRDDAAGEAGRLAPVLVPLADGAVFAEELVDPHGLLHVLRARQVSDEERGVLHDLRGVIGVRPTGQDVLCGLHRPLHVAAEDGVEGDAAEVGVGASSELLQAEGGVRIAGLLAVADEEQGGSAH